MSSLDRYERYLFIYTRHPRIKQVDEQSVSFNNRIRFASTEEVRESLKKLRNFKKRPVKRAHSILPCDSLEDMNYIIVPTFSADANLFLQELVECSALFDTNEKPITIVFPYNGGGDPILALSLQFVLMPSSDFRRAVAMRKSERSKHLGVDIGAFGGYSRDRKTCEPFRSESDLESFWEKTETDDLGNGVKHQRTLKEFISIREEMSSLLPYALTEHIRDPTSIIVATDGFCFSACALFVYSVINNGGAIVSGYGVTHPGDELFGAGQCPSGVLGERGLPQCFEELKDNSKYGLYFAGTYLESYDVSAKMDEVIPGDYTIAPIDVHTGYFDNFDRNNMTDVNALLSKTLDVFSNFSTACNPKNKRLLSVSEKCQSKDANAVRSGFMCNSDGEWDENSCRIAACREGYVVDFENNKCVPNPCDIRYSTSSSSGESSSSGSKSSSAINHPLMALVILALFALCINVIY